MPRPADFRRRPATTRAPMRRWAPASREATLEPRSEQREQAARGRLRDCHDVKVNKGITVAKLRGAPAARVHKCLVTEPECRKRRNGHGIRMRVDAADGRISKVRRCAAARLEVCIAGASDAHTAI